MSFLLDVQNVMSSKLLISALWWRYLKKYHYWSCMCKLKVLSDNVSVVVIAKRRSFCFCFCSFTQIFFLTQTFYLYRNKAVNNSVIKVHRSSICQNFRLTQTIHLCGICFTLWYFRKLYDMFGFCGTVTIGYYKLLNATTGYCS